MTHEKRVADELVLQHLTGLSHIYYTSKANWTYDILISKTRKSNSL